MTTRPYELLARFAPDGTVAGVSVRTITTVGGRDYESDPAPLSGATDPAFLAFTDQFAAAVVAERDEVVAAIESQRETMQAEIDRLTALIPPPPNPRELTPREFLSRISDADKMAIMQSKDPRCMAAMWTLFTTLSVDLDSPILVDLIDALVDAGIQIDETERARIFA